MEQQQQSKRKRRKVTKKRKKNFYKVKTKIIGIVFGSIFLLLFILSHLSMELIEQKVIQKDLENAVRIKNQQIDDLEKSEESWKRLRFRSNLFQEKYTLISYIADVAFRKASKYKISPYTVLSIIHVESRWNPNAKSKVAYGLMQINYGAWKKELKIDLVRICDIEYNIELGCRIFRYYLNMAQGDVEKALFYYNNGSNPNRPFKANHKYVPVVKKAMFNPKTSFNVN